MCVLGRYSYPVLIRTLQSVIPTDDYCRVAEENQSGLFQDIYPSLKPNPNLCFPAPKVMYKSIHQTRRLFSSIILFRKRRRIFLFFRSLLFVSLFKSFFPSPFSLHFFPLFFSVPLSLSFCPFRLSFPTREKCFPFS